MSLAGLTRGICVHDSMNRPKLNLFLKMLFGSLYCKQYETRSGLKVIKLGPCSTQLSKKLILLINVKMSTIVGILTFMNMIKTT